MRRFWVPLIACLAFPLARPTFADTTINFDEFSVPTLRGPPFDGDTYLNLGVRFSTTGVCTSPAPSKPNNDNPAGNDGTGNRSAPASPDATYPPP